ncbi:MAG TPA: 4-alpha-glucanotransferase [Balneola sp.]|jgi:4-alpha-glucanotransferase|nr:4-alpha-glucanotransferase [Balneola sp.]MAO77396.1 4-alpha-glucanotransferase [Balneola sp.]MBF65354.1 4-alpha-glucanotransferase [Balneola sp.]HAH51892.1 4-alpha-glucanotransferase [Balneola sp.]|tara:strand:- start:1395 stop:2885 length:1491 start_codon:yes stop_codon:yes gene_type:complete
MRFPRSSGTLVHPTSFPGKYGIGDFGSEARVFIDFLEATYQNIWQILPLTPTGYGNSPYASYSAFAGNPYLISPDILVEKGLLEKGEAIKAELPSEIKVDYDRSFKNKDRLYKLASDRFYKKIDADQKKKFNSFKKKNKFWLDDYTLFMACGLDCGMQPWNTWDSMLAQRDPEALKSARKKYKKEIAHQLWLQFEFSSQWSELKKYANGKGVRVIGDIPIFVDHNSADVWANPQYFEVDKKGNRKLVAGVPPDYFSKTGQLWGNPLYKWKVLEKDGFSWWVERFKYMFSICDAIRVDHFRGFDAYWEVKASEKTAENGRWVKGPGEKLFDTILQKCGELPILAEDLGFVTEGVERLRDKYNFPGMKIIQFAFDSDSTNSFLPHNYPQNCVAYSGTHDNDTSIGWYNSAPEVEKHRVRVYTRSDGSEPNWEFIRLGMYSVSDQAIFPLQDFMNLDGSHRTNVPGTSSGNWVWRYTDSMLKEIDTERIKELIIDTNRK